MPNVRGRVATQVKQLPPPLPGDGILRAVRASASSTTVLQKGRCEAEIAMRGSGCAARAEIGADAAGALTQGVEKPRASDKPVKLTAKAYTDLKTYATEKGLDLKSVASEAIPVYCASQGSKAELLLLRAKINRVTDRMLDKIEQACEGETLQLDVVKALGPLTVGLIHEIPRLSALLEKSSMSERIPFDWRDTDAEAKESAVK